jgi:ABC-type polysaccharide/polyol phosphate transport system ATPase subunit
MAQPAIRVDGLAKRYTLGDGTGFPGTLYETLSGLFTRRKPSVERELWALRDIDFEVAHGEVAGIIGRNGAGKSTLLKILSRITAPTRGQAVLRGRLASLLEVGTGFHPELTGRENIFLNGAILGMTRAEIARQFDDIVQFAEIGAFVDTPVKRYSSGMYVRLAFSVAAHLDPDILVVDEVLAVGDAEFQQRCLGKMKSVSRDGRTVLFVSHNLESMELLCDRALWLDKGAILEMGPAPRVIQQYRDSIAQAGRGIVEYQSGLVTLESLTATCTTGAADSRLVIDGRIRGQATTGQLWVDLAVENENGTRLVQVAPASRRERGSSLRGGEVLDISCELQLPPLSPGEYFGTAYVHGGAGEALLHVTRIPLLRVAHRTEAPETASPGFTAVLNPQYIYRARVGAG